MNSKPVLIIHGGAGRALKTDPIFRRVRKKIQSILRQSYSVLTNTNALEAVVHAVKLLEDDPDFNAGTGSLLQADGRARLSASLMDGKQMRFSGVINVQNVKNPILLANGLLYEKNRVLAGAEAAGYAKKLGLILKDTRTRQALERWKKLKRSGFDTVGACALDRFGNLASATSTGGRGMERPGRVSDSGMPVANYADARCAISTTGIGEEIMDEGLAVRIAVRVEDGMPLAKAFRKTFAGIASRNRRMGAIALDSRGNVTHAASTESLIYGWQCGKKQKLFERVYRADTSKD